MFPARMQARDVMRAHHAFDPFVVDPDCGVLEFGGDARRAVGLVESTWIRRNRAAGRASVFVLTVRAGAAFAHGWNPGPESSGTRRSRLTA
ncbi:hypothetical protein ABIA38_005521 [Embleya sp. AB8]